MAENIFNKTKECKMIELLEKSGYQAYFVGGCVRDYLISNKNNNFKFEDIDIATNASPEEALAILKPHFSNFNLVGKNFGVLMVEDVEIAQLRGEVYQENSKGKPMVTPVNSIEDDSRRRDFTMNSIYMDVNGKIIDSNDGIKDIDSKLVRSVGQPEERFKEDPSRIMRLFYLASRFNFQIEEGTLQAAVNQKHLIKQTPNALVGKITKKVLSHNVLSKYLEMLHSAELLSTVYPEFAHTLNKPQNPKYHYTDVFGHTIAVIKAAEKAFPGNEEMLMKAWCHDIGKGLEGVREVSSDGHISDIGHELAGAPIAKNLCLRLEFGKDFANEVFFSTKWHGVRLQKGFKLRSYLKIGRKLAEDCSSKPELERKTKSLLSLMGLDAEGFQEDFKKEIKESLNLGENLLSVIQSEPMFVKELPISGNVVSAMWTKKENIKQTGFALNQLLKERPRSEEEAILMAQRIVNKIESEQAPSPKK